MSSDLVDAQGLLTLRAHAFYLYTKGWKFESIALALGRTSRTIRNWAKDDDWRREKDHVKSLLAAMVLAEIVMDAREILKPYQEQETNPEQFEKKIKDMI